jgi:type VI secretion system protein ImpL
MPQSLNLTPQISDNDLRGLEKISELLRYSAPVWLWQLCDSKWSQAKRTEQAVGPVSRCMPKLTILAVSLS